MRHDITFNNRDELLSWMDENFPDAQGLHVDAEGYTVSEVQDCMLKSKGYHLTIIFKTI